ncbi:MAG TPA: hypothetical protein VK994_03645, partial [Bacteroidales bacterium]|nr:hypothetical protein [Bacteroidales bacterium]
MNKIQKRWVLILSVVLAVILILTFTANSIISSKADSFLRNKLAATDTSSYIIDFGSLRVNIFTRSVKVFDISIKQTEAAFENLRTNKHAPIGFEANIERIKIGRVGIFDALEGKSLDIGSVVVSEPLITVYSPEGMFPEKHKQKREETESQPDSSSKLPMDEAFIGNIRIIDGMVRWIDMRNEERVMDVSLLNVEMDDVHVHHPGDDSLSFILDTEELNIMLNSMSMVLPGKLYTLKTDRLDISYKDKQVSLDSLRLIPAYSKSRFGQIVGKQTDRFDLKIANILLSGIEFDSIFNKKAIISKVTLTGPSADIYRDKGIPRDMNHFPKLYQTAIAQLPILLDISVVEIIDGMVDYQEKVEWSTMAGGVTFEDFDITISGISNDKEKINNGLAMRVDATAILMGKADLEL